MASMKAIVNASPLMHLARIKRLRLLNKFFGTVLIPNAVMHEIRGLDISEISFEIITVMNRFAVDDMLGHLHLGEVEVIIGADEHQVKFAVLDDLAARNKASQLGLDVIGTLGILQKANKHGLISDWEKDIQHLRDSGMYMSDELVKRILS
jgi:predicted nucleic acid-binding protein